MFFMSSKGKKREHENPYTSQVNKLFVIWLICYSYSNESF